jgi:alkanesulfonate monooxygenase SsuD/methylene tetrahydromethanopterin reductase-like flavin-dependent oxidoreductase (luciferase family)
MGDLPLMIGGGGEKLTLRLVAEYADMWNSGGSPSEFAHKNNVLNDWCAKVGRDPKEIERTIMAFLPTDDLFEKFVEAGADHVIVSVPSPYDLAPVERAMAILK